MRKRFLLACIGAFVAVATVRADDKLQPFPPIDLIDGAGQPHPVASVLGRATVLNFWATWCGPCRMELPELQKLYNELGGKGLTVLAVNTDAPNAPVDLFVRSTGLTLPVYFLDPMTQNQLGIDRIPFSVLLDNEGRIRRAYAGFSREGMQDLREQVKGLLANKRGQGGK